MANAVLLLSGLEVATGIVKSAHGAVVFLAYGGLRVLPLLDSVAELRISRL